jgi:hypothetical protein
MLRAFFFLPDFVNLLCGLPWQARKKLFEPEIGYPEE